MIHRLRTRFLKKSWGQPPKMDRLRIICVRNKAQTHAETKLFFDDVMEQLGFECGGYALLNGRRTQYINHHPNDDTLSRIVYTFADCEMHGYTLHVNGEMYGGCDNRLMMVIPAQG